MDGIHDCGGMHGFDQVERETDEPFFHSDWERRAFALTMAMPFISLTGDDQFRREIERMSPTHYLDSSYYEKWLEATISLAKEHGLTTDDELTGGAVAPIPEKFKDNPPAVAEEVWDNIHFGASQALPDADVPQKYSVGDRVQTVANLGSGHTRLPRYARGKTGTIESAYGTFIYADSNAATYDPSPVHLYTVVFDATELWGEEGAAGDSVTLDMFEPYLMRVGA
jgi:nitrile hydratase subunit beta